MTRDSQIARIAELVFEHRRDAPSDSPLFDLILDLEATRQSGAPDASEPAREAGLREALAAGDALNLAGGSRNAGTAGPERDARTRREWFEASTRWLAARAALSREPAPRALEAASPEPPEVECGICGDYTAQGVEVHAVCLDTLRTGQSYEAAKWERDQAAALSREPAPPANLRPDIDGPTCWTCGQPCGHLYATPIERPGAGEPASPAWPSRDEIAAMSAAEVNAFLESRGLDVRVVETE